jgi:hypothetical protein
MSGYVYVTSACCNCHRVFSYNPVHVPSIRIKGVREPVCSHCIAKANVVRIKNGLEPLATHPQAYEPIPEEELPW